MTLFLNTSIAGKVTTTTIPGTATYNGVGSASFPTVSNNITAAWTVVKSTDTGLNQIATLSTANLQSFTSNIINSNQEIYFGLAKNVIPNNSPLTVNVQTNKLISNTSVYLLQVVHKDRIIW